MVKNQAEEDKGVAITTSIKHCTQSHRQCNEIKVNKYNSDELKDKQNCLSLHATWSCL